MSSAKRRVAQLPSALALAMLWLLGLPGIAGAQQVASAAEPAQSRFDLLEIRVLGNTVLAARVLESRIYPFLGLNKTIDDIQAARASLEGLYRERGYATVFVDIPEQSVDDGVVRLQVTEGRLARVSVTGLRYFSGRQIRAGLPEATPGTVPKIDELQTQLAAVNTVTPDRVVVPVLKAGASPGTVDLTLKVQDHLPFHGSLELNNQYSPDTTPLRLTGVLRYDDLFGRQDSFSLQYQTAPQNTGNVQVIAGGYAHRIGDDGALLSITGVHSSSNVATVGAITVIGSATIWSMQYSRPFRTLFPGVQQSVNVGVDYKRAQQLVQLTPTSSFATPVSYPNFSAAWSASHLGPHWSWSSSASANFGARGLANSASEFAGKCNACEGSYLYFRSDDTLRYAYTSGFSIALRFAGQFAGEPLVSNEQFVIGGANSIRGYYEAESLGDSGARASLELGTPTWKLAKLAVAGLAFLDDGRSGFEQPLPGEAQGTTLRSWGLGLNLGLADILNGNLTWARAAVPGTHTRNGESRFLFSIRGAW